MQFVHRDRATFMPASGQPAFVGYDLFDPDQPAGRRRAVYRFVFRTVSDPFLDAFDCPDGGAVMPVRGTSTTPVQALVLWNDPMVIRQCEHLAERIQRSATTENGQAAAACRSVLLRLPQPAELDLLVDYLQHHGLTNLCQVLVNTNEFLYVD